jgi:hypothetical protein
MFKIVTFLFLVIFSNALAVANHSYFSNAYWNNSGAEFQVYEGLITKYNEKRKVLAKIILVREWLDPQKKVKTLKNGIPVMKYTFIQKLSAGVYDYHQSATLFFDFHSAQVLKYTMGSQDGCGNTFMIYDGDKLSWNSYFDEEGFSEEVIGRKESVFYDALPLWIRFQLGKEQLVQNSFMLIPSLVSNKKVTATPVNATLKIEMLNQWKEKHLSYPKVYQGEVSFNNEKELYVFDAVFPYRLLYLKKSNQDYFILKKAYFFEYWKYTKNKDAVLIE